MSPLEIGANVFNTASIVLAGKKSVHTWWTGIIGCVLLGVFFWQGKLYAETTLQLFFIVTSVLGWRAWRRSRGDEVAVPIRRAGRRQLLVGTLVALVVTVGYAALLARWTDAAAPLPDSAVLAFSVLAQLLLMARCVATWPFWIVVNTIAVPLYASRGWVLLTLLYAGYWVNAIVAWRAWARAAREPVAEPATEPVRS